MCANIWAQGFKTIIPRNEAFGKSESRLLIILYDVKSRGAFAYMALAEEILRRGTKWRKKDALGKGLGAIFPDLSRKETAKVYQPALH